MTDEVSSGSISMDKRFKLATDRIKVLESEGSRMSEVRKSLAKIIRAYRKADDGRVTIDEIGKALGKIEDLLSILENMNEEERSRTDSGEDEGEDPARKEEKLFDTEGNTVRLDEIRDLLSRISSAGGDTSPMGSYIDKLDEAFANENQSKFESAYESVRPWLVDYLSSVQMEMIEEIISRIENVMPIFTEIGMEELPLRSAEKIERIRLSLVDSDIDGQWSAYQKLKELEKTVENARKNAIEKTRGVASKKRSEIEKKVEKHSGDLRVDNYTQVLQRIDEILEIDPVKANMMMDDLDSTIDEHLRNLALKRLDRFLISVEPLIRKVGALEGTDSELYRSLIDQREELLRISEEDVNQALFQMEILLEKAATTVTKAEERRSDYLRARIDSEKERAESLPEDDREKLMSILEKAESALRNGEIGGSESMVGRALTAFERIQERTTITRIKEDLGKFEARRTEFREYALDTSTLEELLEAVRTIIANGRYDEAGEVMDKTEREIESLNIEGIKVRYQRLMIPVVNTIRELNEEGKDTSEFSAGLEEVKSGFNNREYETALEGLESIKAKIDRLNLKKVLGKAVVDLSSAIDEAEVNDIDTTAYRDRLKTIRAHLSKGEISEAERRISRLKNDLENDLLRIKIKAVQKEIGELVADCIGGGIDTADVEPRIKEANDIMSGGQLNQSFEMLSKIRNELEGKSSDVRVKRLVDAFKNMIIRASILGIDTTEYKAASTKATVRLSANDITGALNEVQGRMKDLEERIALRQKDNEAADEVRGMLIAQEGRINILLEKDVQVVYLKEWVNKIKTLLDEGRVDEASEELNELDVSITTVFKTTQNRDGAVDEIREKVEGKHASGSSRREDINKWAHRSNYLSIPPARENPDGSTAVETPNQAREELEKLVPLIKRAIEVKVKNGQPTTTYREDLSRIKDMVVRKDYMEAYRIAENCLRRIHR
ncbi:MAG: hypothetical protein ACMUIG_08780 [Thermoplasmatota archaeon]